MSDRSPGRFNRRSVMQAVGVSSLFGITGYAAKPEAQEMPQQRPQNQDRKNDAMNQGGQMFQRIPVVDLPVIDAYYECEKVWFIHTSVSDQQMAKRLTEMVNYPTLFAPSLTDGVDPDELENIYVFRNGVDRSDAPPWGGGPFGYQIDILDSVPDDEVYTSLRQPHMVMWNEDAEPEILKSLEQLEEAEQAGRLSIKPTDVVVTAPVVSWPGDPFGSNLHMGMGAAEMEEMCERMSDSSEGQSNDS